MKKSKRSSIVSKDGKSSGVAADKGGQSSSPEATPPEPTPPQPAPPESADGPQEVSVLRASLSLSRAQCLALQNLMSGQSMSQAAIGAGVARATLYRWMNDDPDFRAAHNAWKRDTMAAAQSSVLALTEPSIRAVACAVEAGDAKIGLTILKSLGLLAPPAVGATSADDVRKEQEIERKEQDKKLYNAEMDADFPV